jgi:flagellar biosynthesis/type III secretory pathway chaperone
MDRFPPPTSRERDAPILALCEAYLADEEALLADMLDSLRQVRAAFVERNLNGLATLQNRQEQLVRTSQEMARLRDRLRDSLAPLLGVASDRVTLRAAALSLDEPARGRLLARHASLIDLIRETEQLNHHNATLLGYARGFLDSLFACMTGTTVNESYGPRGERRGALCGSFLEARV